MAATYKGYVNVNLKNSTGDALGTTTAPMITAGSTADVIFHTAATTAADGTILTVGNYKTLTVEIYGTSSSRTVAFIGRGAGAADRALMGINLSDFSTATSTTGTGEIWQFDITGLTSVFMDLQAVSGGNVSVTGRVVA